MWVGGWVDEWVGGGMGEGDLRQPSPVICTAVCKSLVSRNLDK